ncbi:hypothetical protein CAN33_0050020 [Aspergillus niger]|uniref:Uncharacterized protein n=1 Tax=Aspergillus niger TaxID=5061 RepID=A0A505IL47_ASPNG|nr:hypothetical protein CAN33_0050020 [Aspergillus niger]
MVVVGSSELCPEELRAIDGSPNSACLSQEVFSRHQARISLASSPAPTAPPFNSSADASVAFVYFHSAFWPRSTNLILTGPTVLSVSISSDILTAFAILILALLTLPAAVAAAAPSAPTSTLFAIGGPLSM